MTRPTAASGASPRAVRQPSLAAAGADDGTLVRVRDLRTYFWTHGGVVKAVDGVSLDIAEGRTLGLVGESGCGKSITALSIMRLIDPPGAVVGGEILLGPTNLLDLREAEMRGIRGNVISMIFQEPMTSLNPVVAVGGQIAEAIRLHERISQQEAATRAVEMLTSVGISDPARRARQYPHQMSGGMRQRVMIAMALSTQPDLLIADEPTTALDVTIQAQILELMKRVRAGRRMSILLITHDLGVIADMADDVAVMYAGRIVESGSANVTFEEAHHPYTQGLLDSLPRLGEHRRRLPVIEGVVPNPLHLPAGCLFADRCARVMPVCRRTAPPFREVRPGHVSRCWLSPGGGAPEVGPNAPPEVAEPAAERISAPGASRGTLDSSSLTRPRA